MKLLTSHFWPRLSKLVNGDCTFAFTVASRHSQGGTGLSFPAAPPCLIRLGGSIMHFFRPLEQRRELRPSAGAITRAANGWWLLGGQRNTGLDPQLDELLQTARPFMKATHPRSQRAAHLSAQAQPAAQDDHQTMHARIFLSNSGPLAWL
jgi:hypothetical protein